MKKIITIKDLDKWGACKRGDGEDYSDKNLKADLGKRRGWTPMEIANMKIPTENRLWVLLRPELLGEKNLRLFAADCAEHVLHIFEDKYPNDDRPRKAIQAARDYANGKITKEELDAAMAAAWDAAMAAAWDAAMAAAWDAAMAAAWDAARAAARAAARDAERTWQIKRLKKYLKSG